MATPLATSLTAQQPVADRVRGALRRRHVGPAARARLAASYERVVTEPARREPFITARVAPQRAAVRLAELELLDIAARLRAAEPAPREDGVRAARRLITDGGGPMYAGTERDQLKLAARDVLARL